MATFPNTFSEDGDPVDVLVITPIQVNRGCVVQATAYWRYCYDR